MDLFIPSRLNKDDKYGKGIGKVEMKRIVIFVAIGLAIGFIISICFLNSNIQLVLIGTCVAGGIFAVIGYYFSQKNSVNLSPYDYISLVISFYRVQRFFVYKKRKEWGNA